MIGIEHDLFCPAFGCLGNAGFNQSSGNPFSLPFRCNGHFRQFKNIIVFLYQRSRANNRIADKGEPNKSSVGKK
jgi:hypothetical protein